MTYLINTNLNFGASQNILYLMTRIILNKYMMTTNYNITNYYKIIKVEDVEYL